MTAMFHPNLALAQPTPPFIQRIVRGHLTLGNQYHQLDILKSYYTTLLFTHHIQMFCMKIVSYPQRSLQYVERQLASQALCLHASPSQQFYA